MTTEHVLQTDTYEQACKFIQQIGILPLAGLIPDHPSLESITPKQNWHSGTKGDPWLWRARFPGDGVAAYGKFLKKKSVLVSSELFPYFQTVLSGKITVRQRYESGLLSKAAVEVYEAISDEEGIDTRELRSKAGMKAKESKKLFDQALMELQGHAYIVIAGVKGRWNEAGEQSGWNSTAFESAEHWMDGAELSSANVEVSSAKTKLIESFEKTCSTKAVAFLRKAMEL